MNLQFKYVQEVRKTNYHLQNYINIFIELRIIQKLIFSSNPLKVISSHPPNYIQVDHEFSG